MSTRDEEARALEAAFQFLLDLSSGEEKRIPSATRRRARDVVKHFPLDAAGEWSGSLPPWPTRRYRWSSLY